MVTTKKLVSLCGEIPLGLLALWNSRDYLQDKLFHWASESIARRGTRNDKFFRVFRGLECKNSKQQYSGNKVKIFALTIQKYLQ
jgi:hypothetical protein